MDAKIVTSKVLDTYFDLSFQHAASGFPESVIWDKSDFKRPTRQTICSLSLLCVIASNTSNDLDLTNVDVVTGYTTIPNINLTTPTPDISEIEWLSAYRGSICLSEVPPKLWRPKMVSKYTIPEYFDDAIDDILDYGQFSNCVYKPKFERESGKPREILIIYDDTIHKAELEKDLKFGQTVDSSTKQEITQLIKNTGIALQK